MAIIYNDETGGHGGDLARAAQFWNPEKGELIDFSSNINPLGPPPGLLSHLSDALPEIVSYPTPQARGLREELARFLKIASERLLVGNGANELIHLLLLWRRPQRVFIPVPSFSEYERAAALAGSAVERYHLPLHGETDFTGLGQKAAKGDLIILCNPNNPTGKLYRRSELLPMISAAADRGAEVMVDESFLPLTGQVEESLRDEEKAKVWIALSLTKLWSLPGLRLGCMIGPRKGIGALTGCGDPWRVNTLAQKAGLYCLKQQKYLQKTLNLIKTERCYLETELQKTGCFEVYSGAANYILVRSKDPSFRVADFQERLASRGILIRRADNFCTLNHSYFRIAVRQRHENKRLIEEIRACLTGIAPAHNKSAETGGDLA